MEIVITYGTFDLLHQGHLNLLKRAKVLGEYLIVGVTSDSYDKNRGKLNVCNSLAERIENVRNTGLADLIIVEEYEGQKIEDIQKYNVNFFAIGSDWKGKFDYLGEYCSVVYLERTKGISSTLLRSLSKPIIKLGIIGSGRIAKRFIPESKFVSGVNVAGIYNPHIESAKRFALENELNFYTDSLIDFLAKVDAVYIASPHLTHFDYIKQCLISGKHVLCEKPMVLSELECRELFSFAERKNLVLMEAIKTAYCPAFIHLVNIAKSGMIGTIRDIEASFTKLVIGNGRELTKECAGGSMTELASYVLLPIVKLVNTSVSEVNFISYCNEEVDLYTRGNIVYTDVVTSFKVGLGVKTEGSLIISGTKGYLYVPAPWWKTEYFELRFEDLNQTKKYFYKYEGDGLRYELNEFISLINSQNRICNRLSKNDSARIASFIEMYFSNVNLKRIIK